MPPVNDEVPPPARPPDSDGDAPARPSSQPPAPAPLAGLQVSGASLDRLADVYSMDVQLDSLFVPTAEELPVGAVLTLQLRTAASGPDSPPVRVLTRVAERAAATDVRGPGLRLQLLELRPEQARSLRAPQPEAEADAPAAPTAHVLVVDDEPLVREETALLMVQAGYRVTTARNGVEALSRVLGDDAIDLILTDLHMPTMDGWQLLRLVRSRTRVQHVPVIFLTRLTSDAERLKGYELGVSDYLEKPVSAERLQRAVVKQLATVQSAQSSGPPVLRGDLGQVALGSLLSLLELERRSGRLQVDSRGERGVLWLRDGDVVRVDLVGGAHIPAGLPRLMHVLDWERGDFALSAERPEGEDELTMRTTLVLLEHARRRDEGAR